MAPVAPWQHVRSMGEDIVATELVLPEGKILSPVDLGAAAACGHPYLDVRRRPRVAIFPTGTELVEPGTNVKPGDIVEFNSLMLAGQVTRVGRRAAPPADHRRHLRAAQGADLGGARRRTTWCWSTPGSSAGSEDYTARIVGELGELVVHGCAIRPGHPIILGVARGKPIIGIPGYPVSAVLTCELFVKPLVYRLLGTTAADPPEGDRHDHPQDPLADGRGRVPARQARAGRRAADRDAAAARRWRHHVAGAGGRHRADPAPLRGAAGRRRGRGRAAAAARTRSTGRSSRSAATT